MQQQQQALPSRPFSAWAEILGDAVPVEAMVDRLVHHSHVIVLNGGQAVPNRRDIKTTTEWVLRNRTHNRSQKMANVQKKQQKAKHEVTTRGAYIVEEGLDYVLITSEDGEPRGQTWRISILDLAGTSSTEGGVLALLEAFQDFDKLGQLTLQFDEQRTVFRIGFSSRTDYFTLQYFDLNEPVTPAIVDTSLDTYYVLVDQDNQTVEGTTRLPEEVPGCVKEVAELFDTVREPLQWLNDRGISDQYPQGEDEPTVVFKKKSKSECKRKRTSDWLKIVGGLTLAVIAVSTDGAGVAIVGGLAAGVAGGAAGSDAEAEYKKCKKEEKKKKEKKE